MSIIIKGVEMPKNIKDGPLRLGIWSDGAVISYGERVGTAVTLPQKHGRLGDAEEMEALLRVYADDVGPERGEIAGGILKAVSRMRDVNTIIEAEGESQDEA